MGNICKKFFTVFAVWGAICGCTKFDLVFATEAPVPKVNLDILEGFTSEDLEIAKAEMLKSFEEYGEGCCFCGELFRDIKTKVLRRLPEYQRFISERSENMSAYYKNAMMQRFGRGSEAIEFVKSWPSKLSRTEGEICRSPKEVFLAKCRCKFRLAFNMYKPFLEGMYDIMIGDFANILDMLNDCMEDLRFQHVGIQKYTIMIEQKVFEEQRRILQERLDQKMASIDFTEYDRQDDLGRTIEEHKMELELERRRVEEEERQKRIEELRKAKKKLFVVEEEEEDEGIPICI